MEVPAFSARLSLVCPQLRGRKDVIVVYCKCRRQNWTTDTGDSKQKRLELDPSRQIKYYNHTSYCYRLTHILLLTHVSHSAIAKQPVSTVTRLRAGLSRNRLTTGWMNRLRAFLYSHCQDAGRGVKARPAFYLEDIRGLFPRCKGAGAEGRNSWSHNSSHTYVFRKWCIIKNRDNLRTEWQESSSRQYQRLFFLPPGPDY
jgi:hypothetical protein